MKSFIAQFALVVCLSEAFQVNPWSVRSSASRVRTLGKPCAESTIADLDHGRVTRLAMANPLIESMDSFASSSLVTSNLLGIATDIAFGIVGIFSFLAGLAFLSANWLIPQAARQLEDNCRKDFPDLWSEYEAKLEPGESLVNRPDLIQELGNLYNARFVERLQEAEAAQRKARVPSSDTVPAETPSRTSLVNAIDAEVVDQKIQNSEEGAD